MQGSDVRDIAARADVRAALEEASPDLVAAMDREWTPKVEAAVARYLLRMAGRTAPFKGLGAVSVGRVGATTRLVVDADVERREAVLPGDARLVPNPTCRERDRPFRDTHFVDAETFGWTAAAAADEMPVALETRVVDGWRGAPELEVGENVVAALGEAAALVCALTPGRPPAVIREFVRRFLARYGDAEVPLLEALDPEDGLGLAPAPPDVEWMAREKRMLDVIASGAGEWVLSDDDLAVLAPPRSRPLPTAFAVMATLLADGRFRVHGVSGPSGLRLFARHGATDERLAELLREHARAEEALDPEAVYAEVRLGSRHPGERAVLATPPGLREHVIDLTGGTSTLPPADLMVRIAGDRPVLWSRSLDRRVEPRLSSAHAYYEHAHDIHRFLGHLQDPHGDGWIRWDWGRFATAQRLPRVRAGNAILAPALWRGAAARPAVLMHDGRELPVDPASELAASLPGEGTWLEDLPPAPVRSPRGTHRHDLLVPFTAPLTRGLAPCQRLDGGSRVFKPGSEWTTAYLFCGPVAADELLVEVIAPALRGEEWFFLRYPDPEWHLRVRLKGDPGRLLELAQDPRVYRAELATYVRETARYGDIDAAERAFTADSEAVCALLADAPGHAERVYLAAAGVASLPVVLRPPQGRGSRADRDAVRALVADPPAALRERDARWAGDIARLGPHALASLAHMHVNRLLREAVRDLEEAVYDLLPRTTSGTRSSARSTP